MKANLLFAAKCATTTYTPCKNGCQSANSNLFARFAGLKIYALLLLFGGLLSFNAQGQTNINVGSGAGSTASTTFVTNNIALAPRGYRIQVVYTPAELTAAGWVAGNGYVISQIGIKYKNNGAPQALNNYTIRIGHTALDFNTDVPVAGLTTVKNAFTYTTPTAPADPTYDMITLDANFTWNGTSSICIDVCYTTSATTTRPTMYAFTGGIRSVNATSSQCAVATNSASSGSTGKPQVRLVFSSGAACTAPTTQALNIVTTPAGTSASINWTNGNGGGRVVYVNTVNSFTAPTDGSNPTANLAYSSGQQCVFNGTGSGAITVTGLTASTQYFVRVYEYCTPTRNYITTTGTNNPNSFTTTAACTAPNGTVAFGAFSGVSSTATTTNVTYTNGGNVATGYVLLRNSTNTAPTAPASGTAVPSAGSTSFVSGYTVVGTSTTLGSSQAFNSTGLTASTTYYYWVVAYQNTNGPCWFTPTTQASNSQATSAPPPSYCTTSLQSPACFYGYIDNISVSNLNQTATGCSTGYTDYTGTTVNFTQGANYSFTITSAYNINDGFGWWIDYNDNGSFSDAGEFLGNFAASNTGTTTSSISISGTAAVGNHRMRVRGAYFITWTSTAGCTSATYGETHDYTASITAPCTAPTSQATIGSYTNNVSPGTSLTVGWSRGTPSPGNEVIVVGRLTATADVAPTSGTTYTANAAFGTVGTTTGTGNFVVYKGTGTSVNVTALTAGTSYTFTVYEYNSTGTCYKTPGSSSAVTTWAPPTGFSDCYAPANWSLSGGNGSVNTTSAPTSIAFTGPTTGTTLYQITVPTAGTIGFNWITTHGDPTWVTFGYRVNSTSTPITSVASSGTISSVSVNAGDVFAFYGTANAGAFATFVATISNFTRTCPASCTAPNGTVSFGAFSGVTSSATTTNVTFTNGANTATGYVLLRSITNTAPSAPASGTAVPLAGSTSFVSGYTVVGTSTTLGSSQAFNSTGLSGSTTYYYWVVAYQSTNGPCWFTPTTQASNSQATTAASCTAPNGTVAFTFSGVNPVATTVNATYTNGSNVASGYALLRSTANTAPTAPASGTTVPSAGSSVTWGGTYTVVGTITTIGSSVAFSSTSLSCNTPYYYWVVAYQNTSGPCWFTPTHSGNSQTTQGAPSLPSTPSGSQTPCSGVSNNYTITAVSGATSYDWKLEQTVNPVGPVNTASTTASLAFTSSGYLTVQANNSCGSSGYLTSTNRLGISVTTSPTISFPDGQTVSLGCRILITPNPSNAGIAASGGIGVSTSGGITYLTGTFVMASSVQATSGSCSSPVYTITVTTGITNRGTLASGDQTICENQTPNSIAYSTPASGGGITYQWYYKNTNATCPATNDATTGWSIISGAQLSSYSPAQGFVPAGSTYTFACYVGSSSGSGSCGGWSSGCRKITVNAVPSAPSLTVSESSGTANDGTICNGTGLTLSSSAATSYSWSAGGTGQTTTTLSPTTNTTYTVTITNAANCSATASYTVTVTPTPTWYLDADNDSYYTSTQSACTSPGAGWNTTATTSGDCDDNNAALTTNCSGFTWTGATSTAWNVNTNWNPNSVPTATADVTIPNVTNDPIISTAVTINDISLASSATLTVANAGALTLNGTFANAGAVTLQNGGNFMQGNSSSYSGAGTFKVEKSITNTANGYRDVSSPVVTTAADLADDFSVIGQDGVQCWYSYNPYPNVQVYSEALSIVNGNYYEGWLSYTGTGNTLGAMQGVAIRTYQGSAFTLDFTGTPHNGPQSIGITNTPSATTSQDGWNFVGNPYPSNIDWVSVASLNPGISGSYYVFNTTGEYTGNWGTCNAQGNCTGLAGISQNISVGQGFFVKANGNGSFILNNSVRTTNTANFYKTDAIENEIRLTLTDGINNDEILAYTDINATTGNDQGLDAQKIAAGSTIYMSFVMPDNEYAINVIDQITEQTELPLMVWVTADGAYSFSATALNLTGMVAYLKDAQSNTLYDLAVTVPSFTLVGGQSYAGRFSVVFKAAVVSGITINNEPVTKIYSHDNTVFVNRTSSTPATVTITNVLGQRITEMVIYDAKTEILLPVSELSYVFVKVVEGTKSTVGKVLLKSN